MSERLEEIKKRFQAMKELESFKKLAPTELFFDDIEFLIQHAGQTINAQNETIERYKQALETIASGDNHVAHFEDIARWALEGKTNE